MSQSVRTLIPPFILNNFSQGHLAGQLHTVCLFVDTSGFTPLTSALMAHGTEGAEIVAGVLTQIFEPLVEVVYEQGGFVASFAGDAFKAIFPTDEVHAYERAVVTADYIRRYIAENDQAETRFGTFRFSVKVCMADGWVDWGVWQGEVVEDAHQRALYYFEGEGLARCLQADPFAEAGEVVTTESVLAQIPPELVEVEPVDVYFRLDAVADELLEGFPGREPLSTPLNTNLATHFYPTDLFHMQAQGEFRQVVTLFVNLQTLPDGDAFAQQLFTLLAQYGGYLCRLGRIGDKDKGATLLLFWGAPTSYENNVERALHFILALQTQTGIPLRAGITTNLAYAGFVGASQREEYTCHGSYVNLSARHLVGAGWGEIWLDSSSVRQAEAQFIFESHGLHQFKGFTEPRSVFKLRGEKESGVASRVATSIVGRDSELVQLEKALHPLMQGAFAGVITLVGQAGIGKSRLVEALQDRPFLARLHWLFCPADDILRRSLNPFRYFLRRYVENDLDAYLDVLIEDARDTALASELDRTRSFLAALLGLPRPGSLYEQLDPQARTENTYIALKTLFKLESLRQPIVIHIEDAHWLDADSLAFLAQLTRNVAEFPMAVLLSSRPELPTIDFPKEIPTFHLDVQPLSSSQIRRLAMNLLLTMPNDEVMAQIEQRAEGNPFFAEQLLRYWQDVDPAGNTLPNDIRTVLVARLDRLSQSVKETVQTAAVLGREFELQILSAMLRMDFLSTEQSLTSELRQNIEQAEQAAIWAQLTEVRYLFQHALLRDAAYDMQLRAHLRGLHRLALTAYETLYVADLAPHYVELAYHAQQTEDVAKERAYAFLAGTQAAEQFANEEALTYLNRVADLTPETDLTGRYDVYLALERVLAFRGEREAQKAVLAELHRLLPQIDPAGQSEVYLRQAIFNESIADYDESLEASIRATELARQATDQRREADGLLNQGIALWRIGRYADAEVEAKRAIEIATPAGLLDLLSESYRLLGIIADSHHGDPKLAMLYGDQALQLARQTNDKHAEGKCLNNLASYAKALLDLPLAETYYTQAIALAHETGMRRGQAIRRVNLGSLRQQEKRYQLALHEYEQSLELAQEIGERRVMSACLTNMGNLAARLGQFEQAWANYERALTVFADMGIKRGAGVCYVNMGILALSLQDWNLAHTYLHQALAIGQETDYRQLQGLVFNQLGILAQQEGRPKDALGYFTQANELNTVVGQDYYLLESHVGLAWVAWQRNQPELAVSHLDSVLDMLQEAKHVNAAGWPVWVFWEAYQLLTTLNDPRSADMLKQGQAFLQAQREAIDDTVAQNAILQNQPLTDKLIRATL